MLNGAVKEKGMTPYMDGGSAAPPPQSLNIC